MSDNKITAPVKPATRKDTTKVEDLKSLGKSVGQGSLGGVVVAIVMAVLVQFKPDSTASLEWQQRVEKQLEKVELKLETATRDRFTSKDGDEVFGRVRANENELTRRGVMIETMREADRQQNIALDKLQAQIDELKAK